VPFRDAYKQVGHAIEKGEFNPEKKVEHTHEGSIGNLGNEHIELAFNKLIASFDFGRVEHAVRELVKESESEEDGKSES
jgi:argininosuccinate lyase